LDEIGDYGRIKMSFWTTYFLGAYVGLYVNVCAKVLKYVENTCYSGTLNSVSE